MKKTVLGLFNNVNDANATLDELAAAGYTEADVSVITGEGTVDLKSTTGEDIKDAAKTGGIVGGIVGLLVGIGALAVPGVGALFIGGPIAAALGLTGAAATTASGALTGALAGGLIGALRGIGIDEVQARVIEDRLREGDILLMVFPSALEGEEDNVKETLQNNGADHVSVMNLNI